MNDQNTAALKLLDEPARSVVASMHARQPQPNAAGGLHALDGRTRIPLGEGALLYRMVSKLRPALSIEIGLAYGFSTAFILSALKKNGQGRHIALDPFQYTHWHGIGAEVPNRIGCKDIFTFVPRLSYQALPEMAAAGFKAEFIFIDGDHKFDSVIVDFYLADKLLAKGGVIAFDDTDWPSSKKVCAFMLKNRTDYEQVKPVYNRIAIFRKVGDDNRHWEHFVDF